MAESIANEKTGIAVSKLRESYDGLSNGNERIGNNIVEYLGEYFHSDFNIYNDIHSNYEHFLQLSGMEKQLQWLDLKVSENGSTAAIDASDLNEVSIIQDLLKFGLIKLELQKTF
jgi:hypothetical protein